MNISLESPRNELLFFVGRFGVAVFDLADASLGNAVLGARLDLLLRHALFSPDNAEAIRSGFHM